MESKNLSPELSRKFANRKNILLVLSILFDVIGILSYFIPSLGEFGDIVWAPIAGFALYVMYGGYLGVFGGMFVFLEEIIPFTDFLPGFTIMWFLKFVAFRKTSERQFMESYVPDKTLQAKENTKPLSASKA